MAIDFQITKDDTYRNGYNDGYREGYNKALEQFKDTIFLNASCSQIIVTTKENLEGLRNKMKDGKAIL